MIQSIRNTMLRAREWRVVKTIQKFLSGRFYMAALTAFIILVQVAGLDVLGFSVLCTLFFFVCLFGEDTTPLIPAVCMVLFCVSLQNSPWAPASGFTFTPDKWYTIGEASPLYTSTPFLVFVVVMAVLLIVTAAFRIVVFGNVRRVFTRNAVFVGVASLCGSFLLSGAFSASWEWLDLWTSALQAATFFVFFVFFAATAQPTSFTLDYIAGIMVGGMFCMLAALVAVYIRALPLLRYFNRAFQGAILSGWGPSNSLGLYIIFALPACFYKTYKAQKNHKWVWSVVICLGVIGTVLTFCRTALLMLALILPVGFVLLLLHKESRAHALWTLAAYVVLAAGALGVLYVSGFYTKLTDYIADMSISGLVDTLLNGRMQIWKRQWGYFLDNPIFGGGFLADKEAWVQTPIIENEGTLSMFFVVAHSMFFQALGGSGLLGLIALCVQVGTVVWLMVKNRRKECLFLHLALVVFYLVSLVDTIFYATHFTFLYLALVLALQWDYRREKQAHDEEIIRQKNAAADYKPRVVFPFLEAGFGHIMPMRSLADAFEAKYGDVCEVVRSNFFTETNEWSLVRFENVLKRSATQYAKSAAFGAFHVTLMNIFAPWILPQVIMDVYIVGAGKAARRHMRALQPDMVVSTHWATSYYAENIAHKPINVCYVPDAHVVALARYQSDAVLISKRPGYERELKKHSFRFNQDNLRLVPFAIRGEALTISDEKQSARRALGLAEDKITVTVMEGGYGYGKLEQFTARLLQEDLPLNLIVVCGKNEEAHKRLQALPVGKNTTLVLEGVCEPLHYLAASDVLIGKSGASAIAEATYFGCAVLVNRYSTALERGNAEYYIHHVKNALKMFETEEIIQTLAAWCQDKTPMLALQVNARKEKDNYGSEKTADVLFAMLCERFPRLQQRK